MPEVYFFAEAIMNTKPEICIDDYVDGNIFSLVAFCKGTWKAAGNDEKSFIPIMQDMMSGISYTHAWVCIGKYFTIVTENDFGTKCGNCECGYDEDCRDCEDCDQ